MEMYIAQRIRMPCFDVVHHLYYHHKYHEQTNKTKKQWKKKTLIFIKYNQTQIFDPVHIFTYFIFTRKKRKTNTHIFCRHLFLFLFLIFCLENNRRISCISKLSFVFSLRFDYFKRNRNKKIIRKQSNFITQHKDLTRFIL